MSHVPIFHTRSDAQEIYSSNGSTDLFVWLFFPIATGHVLLPLLVATFIFSPTVTRHPTLYSVCATWIIAGIVSSLLFYTGHHVGPEPPKGICITQMTLIEPIPPMTSVATLALVYHTWLTFRPSTLRSGQKVPMSPIVTTCLVVAPYITYLCFAIVALRYALPRPDLVTRSEEFFYCSIHSSSYNHTMNLFTAVACLLTIVFEVHLTIMLSRNWIALRHAGVSTGVDLQLVSRVVIFTAYVVFGTAVMFFTIATHSVLFPNMFATSIGMALFFIFATQPDVLRVWSDILLLRHCRRRQRQRASPPSPSEKKLKLSASALARCPTPLPLFDLALLERTDSEAGEKVRLAALHAYYTARVHDMGVGVEVIKRPEDAFVVGREPRRVWGVVGNAGADWF